MGLSLAEIAIVAGAGLLLFGRRDLPKVGWFVGYAAGRASGLLVRSRQVYDRMAREAHFGPLQEELKQGVREIEGIGDEIRRGVAFRGGRGTERIYRAEPSGSSARVGYGDRNSIIERQDVYGEVGESRDLAQSDRREAMMSESRGKHQPIIDDELRLEAVRSLLEEQESKGRRAGGVSTIVSATGNVNSGNNKAGDKKQFGRAPASSMGKIGTDRLKTEHIRGGADLLSEAIEAEQYLTEIEGFERISENEEDDGMHQEEVSSSSDDRRL